MTGSIIGHYEVGEKLGAGGMGVVYRARDTRLRRQVALKFLPAAMSQSPLARARFLREAQAASALDHPNIATIYEIGEHEGRLYIAMGLYEGETLADRMKRGAMATDECESIVRQLLEAAGAAHACGVVHRDIKPANVLMAKLPTSHSGSGGATQVKVVDFGLAKLRPEGGESATRLTEQGALMGTVAYMSPEQARGEAIDARTDLWSIGVIAYEILAGKHPFEAPSSVGTLTRIATEEPASLDTLRPEVPEHLRRLVADLLHKDLAERPASAEHALAVLAGASVPTAPRPRARRGLRRAGPLVAAAVGLTVLAVVGAGVLLPRWLGGGGGAAPAGEPSLVVLPCQVFGAEEWRYLTDAVPANLSTLLGQVEGLDTRRPPTSLELDPGQPGLERVARAYGVRNCVTCAVTVEGDRLRLDVNVVNPKTDRLVWTQDYAGTTGTYLELIRRSAEDVRAFFLPEATGTLSASAAGADSAAALAFQRGKYYSERYNNRRRKPDYELAMGAFREALDLDPGLGAAAGEIALLKLWSLDAPDTVGTEAAEWARRALDVDPSCGRAWTALSFIAWAEQDPARNLEYALRAWEHAGGDGLAYWPLYAFVKIPSTTLALEVVDRTTTVNPLYSWGYIGQANARFEKGQVREALARLDEALLIDADGYAANAYRAIFLVVAGRTDEARAALERIRDHADPTPPCLRHQAAFAIELASAPRDRREEVIEGFLASHDRGRQCLDEAYRYLVPVLIRHDRADVAMTLLEEYAVAGGMPAYDWLVLNPDLEPLRADPRYGGIEAGARRQYVEARRLLDEARGKGELPEFLSQALDALDRTLAAGGPA